jgi:hypothetical protein
MSTEAIQQLIGKVVVDDAFREQFLAAPETALARRKKICGDFACQKALGTIYNLNCSYQRVFEGIK